MGRYLQLSILILLGSTRGFADIAFVDKSANAATTNVLSIVITNNAGVNGVLDISITVNDPTDSDRVISSVTTAGTNTTLGAGIDEASSNKGTWKYYFLGPPAGISTTTVTTAGVCNGLAMSLATFSGVAQSGQPDAVNAQTNASSSTPSVTITSTVQNAMLVDSYNKFSATAPVTHGANMTMLFNTNIGASHWHASTYQSTTTNGIYRFLYTNGTASASSDAIISYKPFIGGVVQTQQSSDLRLLDSGQ